MADDNNRVQIKSVVITASDALGVITENFDMFVDMVDKTMPRREHLSLMGKDDVYMRVLAQIYTKKKGINAITVVGQEARNLMDYMDILYTANSLRKRNALKTFELDRSEDGKLSLKIQ